MTFRLNSRYKINYIDNKIENDCLKEKSKKMKKGKKKKEKVDQV